MGMFDYVESEVPLPDGFVGELQTKSFDSILTTILIRADGRLMMKSEKFELVQESERPFPDELANHLAGSVRAVSSIWRDLDFHGDFEFYGRGDWRELRIYRARFTHGELEWIRSLTSGGNATDNREVMK